MKWTSSGLLHDAYTHSLHHLFDLHACSAWIASASQLMKYAEVCDFLAKEFGILCFKMEAA